MTTPDPLQQALAELRPNHLPDPITWWPLAPAWWITGLLIITLTTSALILFCRYYKRNRYRRVALHESAAIAAAWQAQGYDKAWIRDFNHLLKRVALSSFPREDVAALHGDNWLTFLDQTSNSSEFTQGSGKIFGNLRYAPTSIPAELQQIQFLVESWIRKHHV